MAWNVFANDTGDLTEIIDADEINENFDWLESDIFPMLAGTKTDATYDLGGIGYRWDKLFLASGIYDTSGNEIIKVAAVASAVNEITITNAATGSNPSIAVSGEDVGVDIEAVTLHNGLVSESVSRIDSYPPISNMYGTVFVAGSGTALVNNRTVNFNDAGLAEIPIRARSGETIVSASINVYTGTAISGTLKLFKSPPTGTTLTEIATVDLNATGDFTATANYVVESGYSVYARITIASSSGGNFLYPLRVTIKGT